MSEKNSPSLNYKSTKRLILSLIVLMGIVIACPIALLGMSLFILYVSRTGYIQTDMPQAIVPTAEYLRVYPMLRPDYILAEPMMEEDSLNKATRICVLVNLKGFLNIPDGALFIVNGARVPENFTTGIPGDDRDASFLYDTRDPKYKGATLSCAKLFLNKGIHLVEFQPSPFMLDTRHNYKWITEVK